MKINQFLDFVLRPSWATFNISLGDIASVASFGVLDDITGSEAAAEAAMQGATQSAQAQLAATEKNIEFQKWLWGEQRALAAPYAEAGAAALPQLGEMAAQPFSFGAEQMYQDPGYQFRLAEGSKALERSAAARGMQLSGRTLKGLQRFGQGLASQEYGAAYGRAASERQQQLSNLFNLASMGQAAAAGQAQAGSQMGGAVGQSILQGGAIQGQMYSDIGQIQAAQAQAPWNSLMQIGQLGATMYGAR